jgi:hypothetical protein
MIREVFNKILKEGLTPNQFYLLYCLKHSTSPIKINGHLELRTLEEGFWHDSKPTEKTELLIKEIEDMFSNKYKQSSTSNMGKDYLDQIKKYVEMFPKKKLPSGKLARSTMKNLETNFKWFFQNYDYDWETILTATAKYVDEYERNNYLYMQTSKYFICKTQQDKSKTSELADYCELIASGGELDEDNYFKEKVV